MLSPDEILTLRIDCLAASGAGVGFVDADTKRAIFIPGTAPGDVVEAKITAQRKAYFEASLIRVITPSQHRVKPPCKHVGVCGACDWLHVSYEEQLRQKESLLRHAFAKQNISLPGVRVVPSSIPYHYRCKVRFPGDGFSARKSNAIVRVDECWLLHESLGNILSARHAKGECWGLDEPTGRATKEEAEVMVDGRPLCYHPSGFVQSHFSLNRELVSLVKERAAGRRVLELYAGNGNLSLSLSSVSGEVLAVEGSPRGFSLLRKNASRHGAKNIIPMHEDARVFLSSCKQAFDVVVLDPPRAGVGEDILLIARLAPRIVYVSCDATSLAREARLLIREGFSLREALLIDLFPQTRHYEAIAVFEKG